MDHPGVVEEVLIQHVKGQTVDAPAKAGQAPLAVFLHLYQAGGGELVGEGEELGVGKALLLLKLADEVAGLVTAHGGDDAGDAAQVLMCCAGNVGYAAAGDGEMTGGNALVAGRRRIHHHQNILGAGAYEQAVQILCQDAHPLSIFRQAGPACKVRYEV